MAVAVTSRVLIAPRGSEDEAALLVSGLRVSWELNVAGSMAFSVPVADVLAAVRANSQTNLTTDLLGYWITYDHPTAGSWGGVITALTQADGLLEVAAQGFLILLRRRLGTIQGEEADSSLTGRSGTLLRAAILSSDSDVVGRVDPEPVPLAGDWALRMDAGPVVTALNVREDIYESILPTLTTNIGCAFIVNADRTVRYGEVEAIGAVRSNRLIEGRHILNTRWVDDLWNITTTFVVTGQLPDGTEVVAATTDTALVARYGSLILRRDIGSVTSPTEVQAAADAALKEAINKQANVELRVADVDECYVDIREGDTLRLLLGTTGVGNARMRVQVRALDVQTGTLTVSGWGWRE